MWLTFISNSMFLFLVIVGVDGSHLKTKQNTQGKLSCKMGQLLSPLQFVNQATYLEKVI